MKEAVLSVKAVVESVLSEDMRARSSDKWLILLVLRRLGYKIYLDYNEMTKMPSFESIRRSRQKLQEAGRFLASPSIQAQRAVNEEEMRRINDWYD